MVSPPNKLPQWMTEQNKVHALVDTKKNPVHRSVLEDNLPFLEFHGSIVYSYNASDCSLLSEDIVTTLPDGVVLGFDIEWPPSYTKGKEGKVALIQLCESEKKCYLFHVSSMSNFPVGLRRLLEDKRIKKAGVGIEGDKWKLMRDFEVKLENLVELADLANEKLKCKEIWSLNDLVKHLFHNQLLKDKQVRCGNWEQFPLTEEQKLYAATDAYAGFLIYQKLAAMSSPKQMLLNVEKDGALMPSKIKKELASLSEEMMDMANCLPGKFEHSTNIQRAVEILADVSENIDALRKALHLESNCQAEPGNVADPDTMCSKEELLSEIMCDSNDFTDRNLGGVQTKMEDEGEDEAELNQKEQIDGASDRGPNKTAEKGFLMSLDITEYELQMLEHQAEEELLNERTYISQDLSFTEDEENPPCTIESDDELEMEMLKSLEGLDKCKMGLTDSSLHKAKRQDDLIADDEDEDEGIEEEEEHWDSFLPGPNAEQIACLKMYFGHSCFKPVQWKVISSVLQDRRDNLVVMATGYGKSLCFQFPPIYTGGTGIVISPLISLMEDQVLQLEMSGIKACLLGSAQSKNVRGEIKAGHYRVIYITPEFCSGNLSWLEELDQTIGITLIAVDEAHCISEWGHDFRNSFRSLGLLKKTLPKVPIVALTATASPSIREDIVDCLHLKTPQVTCTSFDRPNLYLEVQWKSGNIIRDLQQFLLKKDRSYEFEGPTIIYCPSRKTTEHVARELTKLNLSCGTYHAGMGIKARRDVHHRFMRDEIQCVVATVAFGMGINKADIRTVIHYGAPKEMESYYQEIGRAGRDGLPAFCYVLWTQADMSFNRHLLNEIHNERFRLYKLKMMAKIEKYLSLNSCRRKNIHSTPVIDKEDSLQDFGQQAYQLMSAIYALNEKFGMGVPVLFLRGSNSQRLPDKYRNHALYGSGKDWPENSWKALGRQLIMEGFLKEVSGQSKFATTIMLTKKGNDWFSNARKASGRRLLLPSEELYVRKSVVSHKQTPSATGHFSNTTLPKLTPEKQTSLKETFSYREASKVSKGRTLSDKSAIVQSPSKLLPVPLNPEESAVSRREKELQTVLYGKLVAARQKLANEKDIPPAVLATNKVLVNMTMTRPTTVENVKSVDGVSEAKSVMLVPLLNTIKEFCQANGLQMDIIKTSRSRDHPQIGLQKDGGCGTLTDSEHITYTLFQEKNMSLKSISESRSLPLSVVGTHLFQALKAGYPVNLERAGLTHEVQEMITKVIQNPPINSDITRIQDIRTLLPANIELYHVRMTIAQLEKVYRSQQLGQQNYSEKQGPPQESGCLQPSTGSSQKNREILWIETKGDSIKTAIHKPDSGSNESIKQDTSYTDSSSLKAKITKSNSEEHFSGAKQDVRSHQTSIKLASWNQPSLSPEEEELFTDFQSQTLSQPSKRKLPEWFETSKGTVPHVNTSKKSKGGGSKGLFG
ncbi:bifunctional 3'-5' exonuclease/ATP-dependent helicase WRN isoform X2 [Hemicordylus capensis]|uniref:bifunctional 3'-5' exonuclease/ATP-dependent helicase WRN isoform X2 n=1 Tax=Hemicordylus capensis TaxID=884348 RepID=UPI0023034E16|nr:bifunctional 3'-5' exonuclease/ATP-dependent helicase WRN isoform X2 [Hemicordylus capensis]